jgi:hypothetical protein
MPSTYQPSDDLLHQDDGNPAFQDSHWLMWHDTERGIGGFHRLGIHPPRSTSTFVCGVMTHAGDRFRNAEWEIPWAPSTRPSYVVNDAHRLLLEDGRWRLRVTEPDCDVDLTWQSAQPMFHYAAEETVATAHFEGSGTVTGTVRLADRHYEVEAMAFRDRSWGPRDYGAITAHRWFAGTLGPDLTFSAFALLMPNGHLHRDGIVVENGMVHRASDVDIVIHQEADGFSHRGGTLRLRFDAREDLVVSASAIDGMAFPIANGTVYSIDTLCVAEIGGRVGFCNVEASNNVQKVLDKGGTVPLSLAAAIEDGLTRRA